MRVCLVSIGEVATGDPIALNCWASSSSLAYVFTRMRRGDYLVTQIGVPGRSSRSSRIRHVDHPGRMNQMHEKLSRCSRARGADQRRDKFTSISGRRQTLGGKPDRSIASNRLAFVRVAFLSLIEPAGTTISSTSVSRSCVRQSAFSGIPLVRHE